MASRRGFVLVLVVGILGLLLLAGVGLLQVATEARGGSDAIRVLCVVRLASASGMEYAASRLPSGGYPQFRDDAESRSDDWTCRESVFTPLERVKNPSYSHGEPWLNTSIPADGVDNDADGIVDEQNEGNGVRDPAEAFVDRDRDGRFTPASGRLRCEAGGRGAWFLLRIDCPEGRIPVNGGALWGDDVHGSSPNDLGNGVPDCADLAIKYHRGLSHCLNNLGAILAHKDPARLSTRCGDVATGTAANPGAEWETSWLGYDLITRRPPGGYRTMADATRSLLSAGYSPSEAENVRLFLDLGPYDAPPGSGRYESRTHVPYYPCPPIGMTSASPEVLESCWRYLEAVVEPMSVPGDPAGWAEHCSRTGVPGAPGTLRYDQMTASGSFLPILFPDEAEALARCTIRFRQQGLRGWKRYFERLSANASGIFERDCADLAGFPENAEGWAQMKMELAFWGTCMDPPVGAGGRGGATGGHWGIDRDGNPANGVQAFSIVDYYTVIRAAFPASFGASFPTPYMMFRSHGDYLRPQGITLATPVAFRVVSRGVAGEGSEQAEGVLRTGDRLDLGSQEDFECLDPDLACTLVRRGIRIDDPDPETRREIALDDEGTPSKADDRVYPHVLSQPRIGRRGAAPLPLAAMSPYWAYSRCYGSLTLAPREGGRRKAVRYWAFSEDFDGVENVLSLPGSSPWGLKPNLEHYSESAPGVIPPFRRANVGVHPADPDMGNETSALKAYFLPTSPFQLPGLESGAGVRHLAIECWMSPGNSWTLQGGGGIGGPAGAFMLSCARDENVPGVTLFWLSGAWDSNGPQDIGLSGPFSAPDEGMGRLAWDYHVVLQIEGDPIANTTTFRLLVNGSDDVPGNPGLKNVQTVGGWMKVTDDERFAARGIDELRLYGAEIPPNDLRAEALRAYEVERYVRRGTFVSPTYVFEERGRRFGESSWLGFIPPAFHRAIDPSDPIHSAPLIDGDGMPVRLDPFVVSLDGYATRPGDTGHPAFAPGFPRRIPYDQVTDLRGCGEVRSFRYRVQFDASQLAGVLDDSPVFESLWITSSRVDRPVSWSGWSAR